MTGSYLLNDTEAAIKLGITKELLYAYIRNAPKRHLGHDRKLVAIIKDGQSYFDETQLEEFDKYLREPWSDPKDKRPEVPTYIQDYLKTEIGGKCPITGKGYPLENAHIEDYSVSLNHHHHNLIRIAADEHTKADNNVISKGLLKEYKKRLVESLRRKLQQEVNKYQQSYYPPLPHQVFIGREQQLLELTSFMETERMIVIQGIGGIGKTELLLNALRNVQYHNPVLYLDVETINSLDDLLIILQNALIHITGKKTLNSLFDDLRKITITIIFDSLEKLLISQRDEVEDFIINLMTKTENLQLIITSQVDLSIFDGQQTTIQLSGIDNQSVLEFIKIILPETFPVSQKQLDWIIEFCNGHPLSIKLIISLIKFYKNSSKVIEIIDNKNKIEQPLRRKQNKSTSLNVCLSTIYDCFSTEEKSILFYISCFPGGLKTQWLKGKYNDPLVEDRVATIKQFFFIETRFDRLNFERLIIPNPIHPFLSTKSEEYENGFEEIEFDALSRIMMEAMIVDAYYIEGGTYGSPAYGIARIEDDLPNIFEAFYVAEKKAEVAQKINKEKYLQIVTGIASGLGKFCFIRAYFEHGLIFSKAGIKANISLGQINSAATQYMYLAQIYERRFDYKGLEATILEMNEVANRTENVEMKINAAWASGRLASNRSQWEVALKYFNAALDLTLKLDNKNIPIEFNSEVLDEYARSIEPNNIALLKSEIGRVYDFSGNLLEAIKYYKESIQIQESFNDETNLLSTYHHLGYCLIETGSLSEGINYMLKTVEGFNRNGQFEYLANSISELGRIITDRPDILTNDLFDEEKISNALNSLFYQLEDIISRLLQQIDVNEALEAIPNQIVGKLLHLTMFVGLTKFRYLLCDHIYKLTEVFPIKQGKPNLFLAVVNVSFCVGGIDEWGLQANREIILKNIYTSCLLINGGPDINGRTGIFQWLAFWLNHVGLKNGATAEMIWQEAWKQL